MKSEHKAGFVNLVGRPNAGKSTLLNQLTGERLAIMSPKVQTTRHRILGIVNGEGFQIVFTDNPGLLEPRYALQKAMQAAAEEAFEDADVLVWLVDATYEPEDELVERMKQIKVPLAIVVNKVDLITPAQTKQQVDLWGVLAPNAFVLPAAATLRYNVDPLMKWIVEQLPEAPPYYPEDQLTDRSERFFIEEFIREQIFIQYRQEIPYSVEVKVEMFQEEEGLTRILANIFVNKKSQKPILIGKGGQAIKQLGIEARKAIEEFLQKKVYLELHVKIRENWRDQPDQLRHFGYQP